MRLDSAIHAGVQQSKPLHRDATKPLHILLCRSRSVQVTAGLQGECPDPVTLERLWDGIDNIGDSPFRCFWS